MVTSLFADISGFTTLSEQLDDPEALHEIIAPVIAKLAEIAERMDGFIAKYAGDALLVFFGAPVAHEDDPARALLVALDMHRKLPLIIADLPQEAKGLQLHIGVNTGRVISGRFGGEIRTDYSILGDAVILAQRFESMAGSGDTFVGETTFDLTKDQFEFESVGELSLKGKTRPVPAWRLIGTRELPFISGAGLGRPRTAMIGRDAELEAIEGVLALLIRDGRGGLITVTGEPGVGKSRLLREVHERVAARGVRWYQARCLTYGATLAYWPAIDLVRQVMGFKVEDPPDVILDRLETALSDVPSALPYIAKLLGLAAGEELTDLEPEAFRRGLHRAFCDWVAHLSEEGPLILAVEDIHWADSPSQALGIELSRLGATKPVVVYFTARPEGQEVVERVTEAVGAVPQVSLNLARFDASATRLFLRALLDHDPPPRLIDVVAERTQGNPLFVEEIVRALQEQTLLIFDGTRWRMSPSWDTEAVPDTIERVLAARIDLLPAATASVLQAASVVGRVIRLSLMRAVVNEVGDLKDELDRLVTNGFFDPTVDAGEDAVMFHHALVQEVAYGRLLKRHRRDLHRHVVEVAERQYGSGDDVIDLLARHSYLGDMGTAAIDYLTRAADRSRRIFANDQAIQHFRRAVEVAEATNSAPDLVNQLLVEVAELEHLRGEYHVALRLYEQLVETMGEPKAWLGLASTLRTLGEYPEAVGVLDRAFAVVGRTSPTSVPLWAELGHTLFNLGKQEDCETALRAGLKAAGQDETSTAARLLFELARTETETGRLDEALNHAKAAEHMFQKLGDLRGLTTATRVLGGVYSAMGNLDEGAAAGHRALALAERTGIAEEQAGILLNLGFVEMLRGELDLAIGHTSQAIDEFERLGHGSGQAIGYGNLAEYLALAGRVAEADEYCARALDKAHSIGHVETVADVTKTLAALHLARSRLDEAATLAEEACQKFLDLGDVGRAIESLDLAAAAVSQSGDDGRARAIDSRARGLRSAASRAD